MFPFSRKPASDASTAPVIRTGDETERDLGDGLMLTYRTTSNGYGGYCNVAYTLWREDRVVRRITDDNGTFIDFPGYENLDMWSHLATFPPARHTVSFNSALYDADDSDELVFSWTFQPDGRYFEDDTGFGAEKDQEVHLRARLGRDGIWISGFTYTG